jgi:hypothetical protein
MIKKVPGIILVAALLLVAGCKQDMDNTKLAPYMYAYAPVDVGHSVTYDVDSISYNYLQGDSQLIDTTYYQLMEKIIDTFYDINGVVNYGIAVYKRYDTTQPFPVSSYQAWKCIESRNTYETFENDLHFVKLTFPPINGNTWLGNEYLPANDTIADTYQIYNGWTYTYTSVNTPAMVNGHNLDSTVVVSEVNTELTNLIMGVVSQETYALHVGLVYKQFEVINKQDPTSSWTMPNQAVGFRIRMYYHSYTQ